MIWLLNNQKLLLAQQEMGNTFVVRDESSTHSYLQSGSGSVGGRVGARQMCLLVCTQKWVQWALDTVS